MKLILSSLFLVLVSSQVVIGQTCNRGNKSFYKNINKALKEEDFSKKIEKLEKLCKKYPDIPKVFDVLGELYQNEGVFFKRINQYEASMKMLQKANNSFNQAISICPDYHASCYYTIAQNLLSFGENYRAIPYLKKFVAFPQDNALLLGSKYNEKRNNAENILRELEFEQSLYNNPVPFDPKKVKNVSTGLDEYFPMISPDNDLLFFTRRVDRRLLGDIQENIVEEFTLSIKNSNTLEFDDGTPLPTPFNDGSFYNYGTATLSVDNKEMIICACKKETVYNQEYLNCDLYTSKYTRSGKGGNDFVWSPLVNMGPNINTKDGWEAQPSLSSDGQTLFFSSIRKGSRDNDIYISERQEDGSWGAAKPFDLINTAGKDKSPFFHQDGETLYFVSSCSSERLGLGGLDIFYIRKDGESWTEPQNIGFPINSPEDELGVFVSTSGKLAYYSSLKEGEWNIFSFDLYEEARPQEVIIIKGNLETTDGAPISDAYVDIAYSESGKTTQVKVNGDDGKFAAVVKVDKESKEDITISFNKKDLAFNAKVIEYEELKNSVESKLNLETFILENIEENKEYNIPDINFSTDSYALNQKAKNLLTSFASYLQQNEQYKIEIGGHTDDVGDAKRNLELSQSRSDEVMAFLLSKGIDNDRLSAVGYGEKNPKYKNDSESNRAKNRRIEFKIIP